jgi:hypothetical protein
MSYRRRITIRWQSGGGAEDAARWADKITYEAYGHTIFLNYPGEYDQSGDPVFVPADWSRLTLY